MKQKRNKGGILKTEGALIFVLVCLMIAVMTKSCKAEEYGFFKVTLGVEIDRPPWSKDSNEWEGDLPVAFDLGYHWDIHKNQLLEAGYLHDSNVFSGPPFNNDVETVRDMFYVRWGIKFGRR